MKFNKSGGISWRLEMGIFERKEAKSRGQGHIHQHSSAGTSTMGNFAGTDGRAAHAPARDCGNLVGERPDRTCELVRA